MELSYEHGFSNSFPLAPIAEELGILSGLSLYDADNESGLLWELGDYGLGLLEVTDNGSHASINIEMVALIEPWLRED